MPAHPRRPFQRYKTDDTRVFVDTNAYLGGGIQHALDLDFSTVLAYEMSSGLYTKCMQRFGHDATVSLHFKSPKLMGPDLAEHPDDRMLFWLDAGPRTNDGARLGPTTVLEELRVIARHPRHDHTILIDNCRMLDASKESPEFETDVSIDDLRRALLDINPTYDLSFAHGHLPDDILVARVS